MKAELLTWTKEPVYTVATAARRCYSELGNVEMIDEICDKLDKDKEYAEKLIRKVLASGHDGILEAASFTFAIEGVSCEWRKKNVTPALIEGMAWVVKSAQSVTLNMINTNPK